MRKVSKIHLSNYDLVSENVNDFVLISPGIRSACLYQLKENMLHFVTKWCFNTDVLKLALRDNNLEDEITSIILTKDGTIHEFHTKTTKKRSINSDTTSNKRSKQDQDRYISLQKSDNDKNYSFKLEDNITDLKPLSNGLIVAASNSIRIITESEVISYTDTHEITFLKVLKPLQIDTKLFTSLFKSNTAVVVFATSNGIIKYFPLNQIQIAPNNLLTTKVKISDIVYANCESSTLLLIIGINGKIISLSQKDTSPIIQHHHFGSSITKSVLLIDSDPLIQSDYLLLNLSREHLKISKIRKTSDGNITFNPPNTLKLRNDIVLISLIKDATLLICKNGDILYLGRSSINSLLEQDNDATDIGIKSSLAQLSLLSLEQESLQAQISTQNVEFENISLALHFISDVLKHKNARCLLKIKVYGNQNENTSLQLELASKTKFPDEGQWTINTVVSDDMKSFVYSYNLSILKFYKDANGCYYLATIPIECDHRQGINVQTYLTYSVPSTGPIETITGFYSSDEDSISIVPIPMQEFKFSNSYLSNILKTSLDRPQSKEWKSVFQIKELEFPMYRNANKKLSDVSTFEFDEKPFKDDMLLLANKIDTIALKYSTPEMAWACNQQFMECFHHLISVFSKFRLKTVELFEKET